MHFFSSSYLINVHFLFPHSTVHVSRAPPTIYPTKNGALRIFRIRQNKKRARNKNKPAFFLFEKQKHKMRQKRSGQGRALNSLLLLLYNFKRSVTHTECAGEFPRNTFLYPTRCSQLAEHKREAQGWQQIFCLFRVNTGKNTHTHSHAQNREPHNICSIFVGPSPLLASKHLGYVLSHLVQK